MWKTSIKTFCEAPSVSENLQALVRIGYQVAVVSPSQIEEINHLVQAHLSTHPALMNFCYKNSWELAKVIPDVNYIEGFLQARFTYGTQSVTHAWCEYKGNHFDVTPLNKFNWKMGWLKSVHHYTFYKVLHKDILPKDQFYYGRSTEAFCASDVL